MTDTAKLCWRITTSRANLGNGTRILYTIISINVHSLACCDVHAHFHLERVLSDYRLGPNHVFSLYYLPQKIVCPQKNVGNRNPNNNLYFLSPFQLTIETYRNMKPSASSNTTRSHGSRRSVLPTNTFTNAFGYDIIVLTNVYWRQDAMPTNRIRYRAMAPHRRPLQR